MKKRIIATVAALVMVAGISVTAFAAAAPAPGAGFGYGGCGGMGMGGGIMWDADGNFLDRDAFEANLDQWVEDGALSADDKEAYLAQYDYCAEYGGGSVGVRGSGMGCGMGRGMGRWA